MEYWNSYSTFYIELTKQAYCLFNAEKISSILASYDGLHLKYLFQDGITPLEINVMSLKEKNAWLTKERNADYGIDTFLFFKYLDIKEAIRAGNLERVEEIRYEIS